jgi:hypothetical protein
LGRQITARSLCPRGPSRRHSGVSHVPSWYSRCGSGSRHRAAPGNGRRCTPARWSGWWRSPYRRHRPLRPIRSAPVIRSTPSVRSFSTFHRAPRIATSRRITARHVARSVGNTPGTRHLTTSSPHQIVRNRSVHQRTVVGATQLNRQPANGNLTNGNLVIRSVQGMGRASVLRNNTLASLSTGDRKSRAVARTTFQGRLAGQNWRHANGDWHWRHRHRHPVWSKYWSEESPPFMPPGGGSSSAIAHPTSRDMGRSARDATQEAAETARRCLCLDDFARHGSAEHIR